MAFLLEYIQRKLMKKYFIITFENFIIGILYSFIQFLGILIITEGGAMLLLLGMTEIFFWFDLALLIITNFYLIPTIYKLFERIQFSKNYKLKHLNFILLPLILSIFIFIILQLSKLIFAFMYHNNFEIDLRFNQVTEELVSIVVITLICNIFSQNKIGSKLISKLKNMVLP